MTVYLVQTRWGRAFLHLILALRAGHWSWHAAGIIRGLGQAGVSNARQAKSCRGRDARGP